MQSSKNNYMPLPSNIPNSHISFTFVLLFTAISACVLAMLAQGVNFFVYRYPGNLYAPPDTLGIGLILLLMYMGTYLQFGPKSALGKMLKEVIYFFLVMAIMLLMTNAAQYTPFPLIDHKIVSFESSMHINLKAVITWTNSHPILKLILVLTYDSLVFQICFIPLLLIVTKHYSLVRQYYFLFLISAIIGFTFYYFFPTTAPASVINSGFFSEAQKATGIKFHQIHHYITPTTIDGGMIAMPSFHVIWAWFSLYSVKVWPMIFALLLPINLVLVASCVLLGWHYPVDILGSFVVILLSHGIYYIVK